MPYQVRAGAPEDFQAMGLVVAISRANERIVSAGVPQMALAHSGVLGWPS